MFNYVEAIQQLIKDKIQELPADSTEPLKKIKAVYKGDPIIIPNSNLPALTIRVLNGNITGRGTQYDQRVFSIQIRYVYDIRTFMNNPENDLVKFEEEAANLMIKEKSDGSNKLDEFCLAQILRTDPSLNKVCNVSGNIIVNAEYTELRSYLAYEVAMTIEVTKVGPR